MGLIKKEVFLAFLLFLISGMGLWAQNSRQTGADPWQFGTEILNLEQKLVNPGSSTPDRYNALVRLARLRQLSGNLSAAAANWLNAAAINPNDDSALVAGAYCLTAIGEWERAYQVIQPLIASTRREPAVLQAFYLDAYLKTWSFANASPLAALTVDPGFVSLRPMVFYSLWQILTRNPNVSGAGSADFWKTRLVDEYPGSPEALIASGGASVSAVQSPLWMLFPGAPVSSPASQASRPPAPAQAVPSPAPVEPAKPSGNTPVTAPTVAPPPVNAPNTPVLQTGVFSSEANARAQAESLRNAGFIATVFRKLVNGAERWAVTVPAGQNPNKTTQDLKKAGFDSFPVK